MDYVKRLTGVLLAVLMVFVYMPSFAFAEGEDADTNAQIQTEEPDKIKDDTDSTEAPESAEEPADAAQADESAAEEESNEVTAEKGITASGKCGEKVTWSLDSSGVLTIKGTGVMYDYNSDDGSYTPWSSYKSDITEVIVYSGVTSIGDDAFYDCVNLERVTLPTSIKTIGNWSFYGCGSLYDITIPSSVTDFGWQVFYDCSSLTSINIPNKVTAIEFGMFDSCSSLAEITIPGSVTSIDDYAFYYCTSLTEITIPDSVTYIGDDVLCGCYNLTSIKLPASVTHMGNWSFSDFNYLTSVNIPNGLTVIENCAFSSCTSLTSITIPNTVTTIGEEAFYYCTALKSITVPNGVESIENMAFAECEGLTSLTIPDSVTSIGDNVFSGCYNLKTITLPASVTHFGNWSFSGYSNLTSVSLPDGVTTIDDDAFLSCSSLTTVTIPDSVTSIGMSAFDSCYNLTEIIIPDSVTSIGNYAFWGCESLTDITIPNSVTSIGSDAFDDISDDYIVYTTPGSYASTYFPEEHICYMPEITSQPKNVTVFDGQKATFKVAASGSGLKYQWQWRSGSKAWANTTLTGYNTNTLSFTAQTAHDGRQYRCVITNANGGKVVSNAAKITVKEGPEIMTQPENVTTTAGSKAVFRVKADGNSLSYQWQWKSGSRDWADTTMAGYNTDTLSFTAQAAHNGRQYRCVVTDAKGRTAASDGATLTIKAGPAITAQPEDVTVAAGEKATFKVAASGTGLKYQWQWKSGSKAWANTTLSGYNTNTLSFAAQAAHDGRQYRCVVTDSSGNTNESQGATLTIKPGPGITSQPGDVTAVAGETATFKVTATGTGLKYQWQWKSGSRAWANTTLSGYNTNTLSFTVTSAHNGRQYRCVVTDANGISNESYGATLTVKEGPPITLQPQDVYALEGDAVTFRIKASGTGLKYQWQWKSGSRDWANTTLSGYNTDTLSFTAAVAHNGRQYRCVVTDANGLSNRSKGATLTVKTSPDITSQPQAVSVYDGDKATFKVAANGSGLKYQWQWKSGSKAWANTTLSGYNTNTLSFTAQTAHNGRQYRCVITDSKGRTAESNGAKLTIKPSPVISGQPKDLTVSTGDKATFKVTASGNGISYQWQWKSGSRDWADTTMSGYNTDTLSFTAQAAHNGRQYRCVVTDKKGVALASEAATLTVQTVKYRALCIGNNYVGTGSDLSGCINDADAMKGMLSGLENKFTVSERTGVTADGIISAIKSSSSVYSGQTSSDVSLFSFSGHGGYDDYDKQGYIFGEDLDGVSFESLAAALSTVPGKVIVILDSCYSGTSINSRGNTSKDYSKEYYQSMIDAFSGYRLETKLSGGYRFAELAQSKFIVLTAATQYETSSDTGFTDDEGNEIWGGAFIRAIISGMGCAYPSGSYQGSTPADSNGDLLITLGEIYDYAYSWAVEWDQHAQYYGNRSEVLFKRK